MRIITSFERSKAPAWAKYYAISPNGADVFFLNAAKSYCLSLRVPKKGKVPVKVGSFLHRTSRPLPLLKRDLRERDAQLR